MGVVGEDFQYLSTRMEELRLGLPRQALWGQERVTRSRRLKTKLTEINLDKGTGH